jgi:hypothetical protein
MGEPFDVNQINEEIAGLVQEAHDPVGEGISRIRLPRGNGDQVHSESPRAIPRDEQGVSAEAPPDDPINPSYYRRHPSGVECIDIIEHMTFNTGQVFKYIWRAGVKNEETLLEDLRKAQWYLDREIMRLTRAPR